MVVQDLNPAVADLEGSHTYRSHQHRHRWLPHARIQDSPAKLAHQHIHR
jgi:hypothetical protein